MNILIFETDLSGHRLEYIHHLYTLSLRLIEIQFYFVLSDKFNDVRHLFDWPSSSNIHIITIKEDSSGSPGRPSLRTLFRFQYSQSKIINNYVKKYSIDRIFAITAFQYFPFAPFFLNKHLKIDGILYSLFPLSNSGFIYRLVDYIKYFFFKLWPCFDNIYTLNDELSAQVLNNTLFSRKFKYLPDPYTPLADSNIIDIRSFYNIPSDKIIFAHFGGLSLRKGTMDVVESIYLLSKSQKSKYVFIFAGKINSDIHDSFYKKIDELKDETHIIVEDSFCSYDYLASLCQSCNSILIPYKITTQSSGIIGYASQFGKPVIAPDSNLIGRLVKYYHLGLCLNNCSSADLVKAYTAIENNKIPYPSKEYCNDNNLESFLDVISRGFFNKL